MATVTYTVRLRLALWFVWYVRALLVWQWLTRRPVSWSRFDRMLDRAAVVEFEPVTAGTVG